MMKNQLCSFDQPLHNTNRYQRTSGRISGENSDGRTDTADRPAPDDASFRETRTKTETVVWSPEQLERIWRHTTG
jgi:hypothetical protein